MKKVVFVFCSIVLLAAILLSIWRFLVCRENKKMEIQGNKIVLKIEKYRIEHGRLQPSLKEMGINEFEGNGPYYIKLDSVNYKLSFAIGFDDAYEYNSKNHAWDDK